MDVLIIDDEKAVRDSTLLALEMEDHYAEAVSSGMVGIQRLKEEVFDLVFLDLNLGSENGLDILPQIHKRHPHLPIVMFTAEASVATAVNPSQPQLLAVPRPSASAALRRGWASVTRCKQRGQ